VCTRILAVTVPLALVSSGATLRSLRSAEGVTGARPPLQWTALAAGAIVTSSVVIFTMLFYRASAGHGAVLWPLVVAPAGLSLAVLATTAIDTCRLLPRPEADIRQLSIVTEG
jgi:hypothetical protein